MRPKKKLTERQAWRLIGKRIESGEWRRYGLCFEVCDLSREGRINLATDDKMLGRIDAYMDRDPYASPWAFPSGDEPMARAMAAYWLALDAQAEAR